MLYNFLSGSILTIVHYNHSPNVNAEAALEEGDIIKIENDHNVSSARNKKQSPEQITKSGEKEVFDFIYLPKPEEVVRQLGHHGPVGNHTNKIEHTTRRGNNECFNYVYLTKPEEVVPHLRHHAHHNPIVKSTKVNFGNKMNWENSQSDEPKRVVFDVNKNQVWNFSAASLSTGSNTNGKYSLRI